MEVNNVQLRAPAAAAIPLAVWGWLGLPVVCTDPHIHSGRHAVGRSTTRVAATTIAKIIKIRADIL
jgi:hypothetical protein